MDQGEALGWLGSDGDPGSFYRCEGTHDAKGMRTKVRAARRTGGGELAVSDGTRRGTAQEGSWRRRAARREGMCWRPGVMPAPACCGRALGMSWVRLARVLAPQLAQVRDSDSSACLQGRG